MISLIICAKKICIIFGYVSQICRVKLETYMKVFLYFSDCGLKAQYIWKCDPTRFKIHAEILLSI